MSTEHHSQSEVVEFPKSTFDPVPWAQISEAAQRPLEWIVEPLQVAKSVLIMSGPGKTTKTTTLLAMLVNSIEGGTLAGQFKSPGGQRVAWFDGENSVASWSRKYLAVCRGLGVDGQRLIESGRFAYFNKRGLYLDDKRVLADVIAATKATGASVAALDSLTRLHRQKEADAVAMSSFFVDSIWRLRDEAGAAVSLLHHTRKWHGAGEDSPADSMRGSVDLRNVCDTHLSLSRGRKDRNLFKLTVTAQRDADEAGPFYWRIDWTPAGGVRLQAADAAGVHDWKAAGRPPTAFQDAQNLLQKAMTTTPGLIYTEAISTLGEAGISKATAKRAWRALKLADAPGAHDAA
jgi:hypothetical protein